MKKADYSSKDLECVIEKTSELFSRYDFDVENSILSLPKRRRPATRLLEELFIELVVYTHCSVIESGANDGRHTLKYVMRNEMPDDVRWLAVEPNPYCVGEILKRWHSELSLKQREKIRVLQCALGNENNLLKFFIPIVANNYITGTSSLTPNRESEGEVGLWVWIPTITLQKAVEILNCNDYAWWLDVEGYSYACLSNLAVVDRKPVFIMVELEFYDYYGQPMFYDCNHILERQGYILVGRDWMNVGQCNFIYMQSECSFLGLAQSRFKERFRSYFDFIAGK